MYDYISGILTELTPSYAVVENASGIGWLINISLNTYSAIEKLQNVKLYVHHVVREDAQLLFGFADKSEREIFRMLIDVSGIGPNTARVILSSLSPLELQTAVLQEDSRTISRVKGIGAKTAQRLVIDLKDKIAKAGNVSVSASQGIKATSEQREEALSALVMLGYQKGQAEKAVDAALKENPSMSAENLIKYALRNVK
jgi:Holliday junction DNA helicase RuvA